MSDQLDKTPGVTLPNLAGKPVSHLLWADDLVLLAQDQESLQRLLDSLEVFCSKWGLTVNIQKTAIMVFNKASARLKVSETFTYNGTTVPSTKSYCYLGVVFSLNGSFTMNTKNLIGQKALRSIMSLKRSITFSVLAPEILMKIFDLLIVPIATYCHQIWLPETSWVKLSKTNLPDLKTVAADPLERLHLLFMKLSLGVWKKASNCVLWGDTGRLPLSFALKRSVLRYFSRVSKMSTDHPDDQETATPLLVHAFQEQSDLNMDWYRNIALFTSKHGENTFLESWEDSRESNRKLGFYNEIKTSFGNEPFLILDREHVGFISKIRSSTHPLNIERGRFSHYRLGPMSLERERLCPACNTNVLSDLEGLMELPFFEPIVENEAHFLLDCPLYEDLRTRFLVLQEPRLRVVHLRNLFRSHISYGINAVKRTALFIQKALERRSVLIQKVQGC